MLRPCLVALAAAPDRVGLRRPRLAIPVTRDRGQLRNRREWPSGTAGTAGSGTAGTGSGTAATAGHRSGSGSGTAGDSGTGAARAPGRARAGRARR